ncbi:hypothetical protein DNU06_02680 [Putridiphycobacter roseus]|uniref:Four helix bundle protein n=1 Tax=Putridiphycobacter roseus TaxID=2219161 RepID=A0A2W1NSX8_9FLAO|nr:hypothetical protein [Putridiphycobacter roseus]PZE18752.1 hypothetical protein DNU06_02680 [Putridiphycobacter roseus]
MTISPELYLAKTNARKLSREMIKTVFLITEQVPPNEFKTNLRKKVLEISSSIAHATVQVVKEVQAAHYVAIMGEIRALLHLINEGKEHGFVSDHGFVLVRVSISDLICSLDYLTKWIGCFK